MGLNMNGGCLRCHAQLAPSCEAYICSFECTFCPLCAGEMMMVCPICGGELLRRPRRIQPHRRQEPIGQVVYLPERIS